eukprot:c14964_g1_i1.p1 GENE.c14964_g1_i1~~c14964_g1_i1.p1  ORF type:complete len:307 (+),score=66.13 c14964_g1_i1:38-922(+)
MTERQVKMRAAVEIAKSQFVTGLFFALGLVMLVSQIPVWVSPSKTLTRAFHTHPPTDLALAQEIFLSVHSSIGMVFVAAVAVSTAFRPHRMIIGAFAVLTLFFFGAAAYEIHNLHASHGAIGALVCNLIFFLLCVVAWFKSPSSERAASVPLFVRLFCFAFAVAFIASGIFNIIVPETAHQSFTVTRPTDSNSISQIKILTVLDGFFLVFAGFIGFLNFIKPDRQVALIITALLFAHIVFWAHGIENREYYQLNYNSQVSWETVQVLLFVCGCVATVLIEETGASLHSQLQETA